MWPQDEYNTRDAVKKEKEINMPLPQKHSIWSLTQFPNNKNDLQYTPNTVKLLLEHYASSTDTIHTCCSKYGVDYGDFLKLEESFPEIGTFYRIAQAKKAKSYGAAAIDLYKGEKPPDDAYEEFKGNIRLSPAYVTYMRDKHNAYLKQAQIHESGSHVPSQKHEVNRKSLDVHLNKDCKTTSELADTIDKLLNPDS